MVISAGGTMMKTMMREMEEKNQHAGGGDYSSFGLYILFIIISLSSLHGVHTHNTPRCIYIYVFLYLSERERCAGYFQKITHHGLRWSSGALQGSPRRLNKNIILTHRGEPCCMAAMSTAQCHTSKRRVFWNCCRLRDGN